MTSIHKGPLEFSMFDMFIWNVEVVNLSDKISISQLISSDKMSSAIEKKEMIKILIFSNQTFLFYWSQNMLFVTNEGEKHDIQF